MVSLAKLVGCNLMAWTSMSSSVSADEITLTCQWDMSDPPYVAEIFIDVGSGIVTRDGAQMYEVLKITDKSIWLSVQTSGESAFGFQSIERSPVGGVWTDYFVTVDGNAAATTGGYCVEK